jgi:hypothetical protein
MLTHLMGTFGPTFNVCSQSLLLKHETVCVTCVYVCNGAVTCLPSLKRYVSSDGWRSAALIIIIVSEEFNVSQTIWKISGPQGRDSKPIQSGPCIQLVHNYDAHSIWQLIEVTTISTASGRRHDYIRARLRFWINLSVINVHLIKFWRQFEAPTSTIVNRMKN